jgi:hypothetical protein
MQNPENKICSNGTKNKNSSVNCMLYSNCIPLMNRNKIKRWLILILILITSGILLIILYHRGEDRYLIANEPNLKKPDNQEVIGTTESNKAIPDFNISQLSVSEWNTPSGLPYSQVPGANLGPTAFQIIDNNRIAFLCNSTNEIIITNKTMGKAIERFPVSFAPRDFVFDKGMYYVLFENKVISYDEKGNEGIKFPFPSEYLGVERLTRCNDATYLLLPSGNSLLIEKGGSPVKPVEYNGIITETGQFITTRLTGDNSYSLTVQGSANKTFEKTFPTDKKVAGVYVVGATNDRVILDVQTFISENPISVERTVASVDLNKNGVGAFVNKSEVPDCYYVISNKDFYISKNGYIYNMMTTPQGVFIFLLTESKSDQSEGYPSSIAKIQYQSNDNLIKLD